MQKIGTSSIRAGMQEDTRGGSKVRQKAAGFWNPDRPAAAYPGLLITVSLAMCSMLRMSDICIGILRSFGCELGSSVVSPFLFAIVISAGMGHELVDGGMRHITTH